MWDSEKAVKKQRKRTTLAVNRFKGKFLEKSYESSKHLAGEKFRRTGRGSDYKDSQGYVELKSSATAPVSKLQKKTAKKKRNYRVERVNMWGW